MRRALLLAAILVLSSISLAPSAKAEQVGYQWTDHFNYSSVQDMQAAGWSIGVPGQITFNTSTVILSGVGQDNPIGYSDLPLGISDWRAESRGRWTGGGGGTIGVDLSTEHKSYSWWIDGYYNTYVFSVGPSKLLQIPAAPLQLDQWNVMTMLKTGNNISFYHNSQYIARYFDNSTMGEVRSVSNIAPWQGITEYDYFSLDAAPAVSWQRTYGGAASDTGYNAVATSDGGFALLGVTKSYGLGQFDAYLIRTDGNGNELWNRTYGSTMGDWSYSLTATSDGGFLIGGTTTTTSGFRAWMCKVTSTGTVEWNKTYGSVAQVCFSAIQTGDGGYAITGYKSVPSHATDIFLLKTDAGGNQMWERTYGGISDDWGKSLIQTSDSGYAITGWTNSIGAGTKGFLLKTDPSGVEQFNNTFGVTGGTVCYGGIQLADGGFAIAGHTTSMGNGLNDILGIRTDSMGAVLWMRTYGGAGEDYGFSPFALDDGFVFSGSTASYNSTLNRIILIRTDLNGTMLFAGVYGPSVPVSGTIPIRLADGGFLGIGNTNAYSSGADNVYAIRLAGNSNTVADAPIGLTATPGNAQVALSWTAPSFNGGSAITGYKVYRSTTSGGPYALIASPSGPSYIDSGLINGQSYWYAVSAVSIAGEGVRTPLLSSTPFTPTPPPLPPLDSPTILADAAAPVAAVAVGTGLAFLGVFVVGRASETVATASSTVDASMGEARARLRRLFRLDKVFDFVLGYFKGRAVSHVWKQVGKVEPEDTVAVHRQSLFAGFSGRELGVIVFTSVFLGLAFMITNKIDLSSPSFWLTYILVAGLAVILHDLTHRYTAWRYNVVTEYKFWFLGTIIMFITAVLFGVVYSYPSRLAINDPKKMTAKQQAIVYGSGPIVSFIVFAIFLALIPLGGTAATIGKLGATMNLLTAVYALMPFEPMDGRRVYIWKKWAWAALFVPMIVLYFALTIFIL
jgi:Zn-dependent protease